MKGGFAVLRAFFNILNFEHVQQAVVVKLRNRKLFEKEDME